jgi:pathogenesis-related protein 1
LPKLRRRPPLLGSLLSLAWLVSACDVAEVGDPMLPDRPDIPLDAGLGTGVAGPELDAGASEDAAPVDGSSLVDARPEPLGPEPGVLAGITAEHNAARARAATSTPLPTLSWSPEIAAVAQGYANQLAKGCANMLSHSSPSERHEWGENLAAFAITGGKGDEPNGSARDTVLLWESEAECYSFGPFQSGVNATCNEACRAYGGCGHLTQMLWRTTQRIGCGQAECAEGNTRKSYWVCNYDPPGNYTGQLPY